MIKTVDLKLKKILLSEENPRIKLNDLIIENNTILKSIVDEQGKKLVNLAEDILKQGLSPLDRIAVYPSKSRIGYFVVAEGNRRVSALMILNDPSLLKAIDIGLYTDLELILSKSKNKPVDTLNCVLFSNWEDEKLHHWIQNRHMGENEGRGLSTWDSTQKAKYNRNQQGYDRLLDFWDMLIRNEILTQEQVNSVSKTNWERILNTDGLNYLGITKTKKEYIVPNIESELFIKKIRLIVNKLAGQSVKIVYDKKAVELLIARMKDNLLLPTSTNLELDFPKTDESDSDSKSPNLDEVKNAPISSDKIEKYPRDIFFNCKSIIPKSHKIKSDSKRINSIINELKLLDVDEYPNACASLCRLLFELSSKYYLENNDLVPKDRDIEAVSFTESIKQSSTHMRNNKLLAKSNFEQLKVDKETLRLIFNGHMHALNNFPSTHALKNFFKSHEDFLKNCLMTGQN